MHVSYPYGRLVNDGLWHVPDRAQLLDAKGNVREGLARERDAPAGFTPDVLATFEREPELIDVLALHLLDRHFAPGLHEENLEGVGFELGTGLDSLAVAVGLNWWPSHRESNSMSNDATSSRLSPAEAALFAAYLIHTYEQEKGRSITRLRLSRDSIRRLALRHRLREAFIADLQDELASRWGWIAFEHGEEFGLIRTEAVSGWVRIATKRVAAERKKLRRGDRSVLKTLYEALADKWPEGREDGELDD